MVLQTFLQLELEREPSLLTLVTQVVIFDVVQDLGHNGIGLLGQSWRDGDSKVGVYT